MNEIIHGDNVEVLKTFENECIDLTVTSPPYDNLRTYKGHTWDFENLAKELFRVTKQGGVVVWVVGDATINGSETGTSFKQALYFMDIGFRLHDTMIYKSAKPPLTHNRYEQEFEYIFILSKGKPKTFNPIKVKTNYAGQVGKFHYSSASGKDGRAMRQRENETKVTNDFKIKGNIWEYATGWCGSSKDKIAFQHPAIFPEQLARDHIISWSNEGDVVLDPFSGSGTTCKMAKLANRNYIGIEIAQEYCEIAEQRTTNAIPQNNLFKVV